MARDRGPHEGDKPVSRIRENIEQGLQAVHSSTERMTHIVAMDRHSIVQQDVEMLRENAFALLALVDLLQKQEAAE